MDAWLTARLAEVRARLTPADEGSLWLLAFDDPTTEPVLAVAIADIPRGLDEVAIGSLVTVADGIDAGALLFVLPRRTGRPDDGDRRLWGELQHADTLVLDLLVVGPSSHWSAAHDSTRPASGRGRAGPT